MRQVKSAIRSDKRKVQKTFLKNTNLSNVLLLLVKHRRGMINQKVISEFVWHDVSSDFRCLLTVPITKHFNQSVQTLFTAFFKEVVSAIYCGFLLIWL
jgi:hypothetical protein